MGLFNFLKKKSVELVNVIIEEPREIQLVEPEPVEEIKVKTYKIAGVSFRKAEIMSLAVENENYTLSKKELIDEYLVNERIYEYEFYSIKTTLVPEPNNPEDPNAVKVIVDGVHIGYIKSGSCSHVLKLIRDDRIKDIACHIGGGKYKCLLSDEYDERYTLEKGEIEFYARLEIKELQ